LSLSGADNLNFNDKETWPHPDVFPQDGEHAAPPYLQLIGGLVAQKKAFLRPELSFSHHSKVMNASKVKRKLGSGNLETMDFMKLYLAPVEGH
jgi:hypothetical protein